MGNVTPKAHAMSSNLSRNEGLYKFIYPRLQLNWSGVHIAS